MMIARMRVVGGGEQGEEFEIQLPATIGRGRNNSIKLAQPLVSRQHCRISQKGDLLVVVDLDSLNGTYVGSERIAGDALLRPGDLLTIGTVTFRAIYGDYDPDGDANQETQIDWDQHAAGSLEDEPDTTHVLTEDTVNLADGNTVIDPATDPKPNRPAVPRHQHPSQEVR